jgi:hypothetical protein
LQRSTDEEYVAALGRAGVRSLAPGEMPLYTQLSEEFFTRGVRLDRPDRDPLLGFGLDDAVVLLTPVVLEACRQLWATLSEKAAETATEEANDLLHRIRLRLSRGAAQDPPPARPEFSAEELALVRVEVARCAAGLDLSESRQRLLSDAVVGALAAPAPTAASGQ